MAAHFTYRDAYGQRAHRVNRDQAPILDILAHPGGFLPLRCPHAAHDF
jgi:hypothetical protein